MGRKWQTLLTAVVFFTVSVCAQDRPNFSGTWEEDTGSPNQTRTEEILQQGSGLKVTWSIGFYGGRIGAAIGDATTYWVDGTEEYKLTSVGQQWTTLNWQGSALAFLKVVREGQRVTVTRETWTLSDDGKILTKLRRTIGPEKADVLKVLFHRR